MDGHKPPPSSARCQNVPHPIQRTVRHSFAAQMSIHTLSAVEKMPHGKFWMGNSQSESYSMNERRSVGCILSADVSPEHTAPGGREKIGRVLAQDHSSKADLGPSTWSAIAQMCTILSHQSRDTPALLSHGVRHALGPLANVKDIEFEFAARLRTDAQSDGTMLASTEGDRPGMRSIRSRQQPTT